MCLPVLKALKTSRQVIDTFRGYNHNLRISDGEFFDMKNMTSDDHPVLAPRGKRGVYASAAAPNGIIAKDKLCYVDGADIVIGQERVAMQLSTDAESCPKQMVSMGAYIIIMPDKKYINTENLADYGDIEAKFDKKDLPAGTTEVSVLLGICTMAGDDLKYHFEPTIPNNAEHGAVWRDPSKSPTAYMQYSADSKVWTTMSEVYVKMEIQGIGKKFRQNDSVVVGGLSDSNAWLCGTKVLTAVDDDYIVFRATPPAIIMAMNFMNGFFPLWIKRSMPAMDFVIESGNRLWGCRYGKNNDGVMVNEIYASKLGDFKNWDCFAGISTDSYTASCGTDGPFTGAITHLGYPLFFKENCVHKVYGSYPSNYQIQTTTCRGVENGSSKSLAIVNEVLFYKSRGCVCAYDGSLPTEVSYALGNEQYRDAVAGSLGNKYYISMKDISDVWHLFVYDMAKGMWHQEDNLHVEEFASLRGELYAIDHDTKKILTMLGSGTQSEESVKWMAQTGVIGTDMPDMKYISRLNVRMMLPQGARVRIFAQYDSVGNWEQLCTLVGTNLRSFTIPIRPRRCDHMRLRIEGEGDVRIYSITKTIEQGSDIS